MVGLTILGIILVIIILICLIPVGVDVDFTDERLTVSAKLCGILFRVFPRPPKPKGEKKNSKKPEEKTEEKEPEPQPEQAPKKKRQLPLNMNFDELTGLLKAVLRGLGKFRKTVVDRFLLHVTVAGSDPYKTAISYGYLNAFLSSLAPACKANLTVKKSDIYTDIDFLSDWTKIDFGLALSIRIGQIFGILNTILFGAGKILIRNRIRVFKLRREEKKNGTVSEETQSQEIIIDSNTANTEELQEDERNKDNGQN